jgi:Mce-associated membrane protein
VTSTPGSSPTWYDVLGVPRDASTAEIKAAWRNATDKFEPGSGSGQFRMFNEAADVLLDPERRREYDASLSAPGRASAPVTEDQAPPPPPPMPITGQGTHVDPAAERRRKRSERRERRAESAAARPVGEPASRRAIVLAAVLALLTVGALVVAGIFAVDAQEEASVSDARDQAPAAAERASKAILSYDYRRLAADRKRAASYLTDDYAKEYEKTFSLLEKQKDGTAGAAVQTKTVVTANVLGSGVMDAEDDEARVLVFVNQVSKRPDREPQIFQNRVAVKMEKDGNRWLVDDLKSY